jgi:hypothetical protein
MAFANPIRTYRFAIEIDGVDQWAIQKVTRPELGMSVLTHGGGDHDIKTASKKTIGNATLEKLKSLEAPDFFGFSWIEACVNTLPTSYKRNIVFKELANDGVTVVNKELWIGCFPIKYGRSEANRTADENLLETLELSVDNVIPLP